MGRGPYRGEVANTNLGLAASPGGWWSIVGVWSCGYIDSQGDIRAVTPATTPGGCNQCKVL